MKVICLILSLSMLNYISVIEYLNKWTDQTYLCDSRIFPNLSTLFKTLYFVHHVRSFSALRRLKVYLRSTISEDRLNGLALLNVHRNIKIDLTEAVDQFAHAHPRRLHFLHMHVHNGVCSI